MPKKRERLKKRTILLALDEEALLSMRRILFRRGLGAQEFFAFIVERLIFEDENLEVLVHELSELKTEHVMRGGVERRDVTADSLYEAIEAKLKEKNRTNEEDDFSKKD